MTKQSLLLVAALALAGCGGGKGSQGDPGPTGTPGPSGTPSNAPTLTSIAPYHASEAMEVTITGTGFSTTAADNVVYFGGTPGNVISATATEIVVNPAAGGFSEEIDVTVSTNNQTSNSLKFFLGFTGDLDFLDVVSPTSLTDVVRLADGTAIAPDPNTGRIFKISATGIISAIDFTSNAPMSVARLARRANGHVLLFDQSLGLVWNLDPATNDLTVFRLGAYAGGASVGTDTFLLRNGNIVDRIAANGTVTSGFHTFTNCTGRSDFAAIGNNLFVAGSTTAGQTNRVCWVDGTDNLVNGTLAPAVAGEDFTVAGGVDIAGADLVIGGTITGLGNGIAALTPDLAGSTYTRVVSTLVLPTAPQGVAVAGGGNFLVIDGSSMLNVNLTDMKILAAPLAPLRMVESEGTVYALNGVFEFGMVAELIGDGTWRVVASDPTLGEPWLDLIPGDGVVFVTSIFEGVKSINVTTGVQTLVVDRTAVDVTGHVVRDAVGNFYVTNLDATVAKYDAQGGNEVLGVVTGSSFASIEVQLILNGNTLTMADANGDLVTADLLVVGGTPTVLSSQALTGVFMTTVVNSKAGGLIGSDQNGNAYSVSAEGFLTPMAQTGLATFGLSLLADGRILVADPTATGNNIPLYSLLP